MKTGCAIETMQFEKIERLEPAIAVLSAVTTTLLRLRDAARAPDAETRPAQDVVDAEYVEVLCGHYGKQLGQPSVKKFYMHVASASAAIKTAKLPTSSPAGSPSGVAG